MDFEIDLLGSLPSGCSVEIDVKGDPPSRVRLRAVEIDGQFHAWGPWLPFQTPLAFDFEQLR